MEQNHKTLGWHDYAESLLPPHAESYLDYGCGSGAMLARAASHVTRSFGIDVDPDVLPSIPGTEVTAVREGDPLPFADSSFDLITCLEVIEHVADEHQTFGELSRVLKTGGTLILTTPHKGWLTWMDPGNVKFVFPKLHRFIHRLSGNKDYATQFGAERRENLGMISDISANQENPWHRHYRYEEIRALAPASLETVKVEVMYPGMRLCWCIAIVWKALFRRDPRWVQQITRPLSRWNTTGGDQLVILFRKTA